MYFGLRPHLFPHLGFIFNSNMTNLFALCLIVSTLTAAGLWSPSPSQNVIVKEGHRVVVVEYDDQGQHNTKVSISSEPGQDVSNEDSERHPTRDLICDVYGKCKHKIASAVEKAKVVVSETAQEAHDVGEAVSDAFKEAKEKTKEGAKETLKEAKEKTKEGAKETLKEAKETVSDKSQHVGTVVKEGAKKTVKEAKAKEEEVLEGAERLARETGREARQTAEKIKTGGNKLREYLMAIIDRAVKPMRKGKAMMDVLGLLGFAMALGMGVWTTFISSYVLASALPRQQFAVVQSKIYPVYFRAMASCIGMALFGHLFSHTKWMFPVPKTAEVVQGYVLVAALLMIFANSLYMEPRATKVMFERLKIEKEEGRGIEDIAGEARNVNDNPPAIRTSTPTEVVDREVMKSRMVKLNKRLKKLNSYSSLLNLLTLMALTWHLVYLSQRFSNPSYD